MPHVIPVAVAPERDDDQVARPVASEVRILPAHGTPPVIRTVPDTVRVVVGELVPIPTKLPTLYITDPVRASPRVASALGI